jgi:nicotinamide riboside transporter PnuC
MIDYVFCLSLIATICSLAGNILVNCKKKSGFIVWTISNLLWIAVNFLGTPNIMQITMFVAYGCLNIIGFAQWSRKGEKNKE